MGVRVCNSVGGLGESSSFIECTVAFDGSELSPKDPFVEPTTQEVGFEVGCRPTPAPRS